MAWLFPLIAVGVVVGLATVMDRIGPRSAIRRDEPWGGSSERGTANRQFTLTGPLRTRISLREAAADNTLS